MKVIYVQHFLNNSGQYYFHNDWYPRVKAALLRQRGFISIEAKEDRKFADCIHITLKFDTDENLQKWVATDLHASVIDQLDPFRTREWMWCGVELNDLDPEPELTSLEWQKVKRL